MIMQAIAAIGMTARRADAADAAILAMDQMN
jgi:hypothetical protein